MVRDNKMRVGRKFIDLNNILRREIEPRVGRRVSNRELSDNIASFLDEERLLPIILRRVNNRRGGGLF